MEWYGPSDTWPRHSRDYFRDAIQYARNANWHLAKYSAHSFGRVVCNRDKSSRCEFLILSTGSGSESKALELRSLVDRCPHKEPAGGRKSAVSVATELLNEADKLINAALKCIAADDKRAQAYELLAIAAERTDEAQTTLDRAVDLETAAGEDHRDAVELADAAGYPAEAEVTPRPLLDAAKSRVDTAGRRLARSSSGRERSRVRKRVRDTQQYVSDLRDELSK